MDPSSLRAHLLASLSKLPNADPLHLVTLVSQPKRTSEIYPHTPNAPRCFVLQYFVVLGVEVPVGPGPDSGPTGVARGEDGTVTTTTTTSTSTSATANGTSTTADSSDPSFTGTATATDTMAPGSNPPRPPTPTLTLLTSALTANLYILPHRAESILYIEKVDSSSYGPPAPLALTRTLVSAFISHFLAPPSPTPTLRVQLFARSQGQYLFPNSAGNGRKAGISGGRLCGWWKGVYEDAVRQALGSVSGGEGGGGGGEGDEDGVATLGSEGERTSKMQARDVKLSYLLPSYSALEAASLMGPPKKPLPPGVAWVYEPPFPPRTRTRTEGQEGAEAGNIGDCIPSLPDDPKTRFLDELAISAGQKGDEVDGEGDVDADASARKRQRRQGPSTSSPALSVSEESTPAVTIASNTASDTIPQASDTPLSALAPTSQSASEHPAADPKPIDAEAGAGPETRISDTRKEPTAGPTRTFKRHASKSNTSLPANANANANANASSSADRSRMAAAQEDERKRRSDHAALARVSYAEFWERLGYRQECMMDITGFFSLVVRPNTGVVSDTADGPSQTLPVPVLPALPTASTSTTTAATAAAAAPSPAVIPKSTSTPDGRASDPTPGRFQLSQPLMDRLHAALANTDFHTLALASHGSARWLDTVRRLVQDEFGDEGLAACVEMIPAKSAEEVARIRDSSGSGKGTGGATEAQAAVTVLQPRRKKRV